MSSSSNPLVRASAETLSSHINEQVLIIGKVDTQQGSEATFILNDGKISVHAGTAIEPLEIGAIYQVLGKVIDDSSIKAHTVSKLPTSELPPASFEKRLLQLRSAPILKHIFMPRTDEFSQ